MMQLILYDTDDGKSQIQLRVDIGTVWLTQLEMAELFDATKQNISLHLKNIFEDGELNPDSFVQESLTTDAHGKCQGILDSSKITACRVTTTEKSSAVHLGYLTFPIRDAVRRELSWTHYRLLLRVDSPAARQWYVNEAATQNWSLRRLPHEDTQNVCAWKL